MKFRPNLWLRLIPTNSQFLITRSRVMKITSRVSAGIFPLNLECNKIHPYYNFHAFSAFTSSILVGIYIILKVVYIFDLNLSAKSPFS